jgi:hypothetical protein
MNEVPIDFNDDKFLSDQQKYGAANIDTLACLLSAGMFSSEKKAMLAEAYINGINSSLRRCFPRDALVNLEALNLVADSIIPLGNINLDSLWIRIITELSFETKAEIHTKDAWQHFRHIKPEDFSDSRYTSIVAELSEFIAETIRRSHLENNQDML